MQTQLSNILQEAKEQLKNAVNEAEAEELRIRLLGKKGGCAAFTAHELEQLKKLYNQHAGLDPQRLKTACANATEKTIAAIAYELHQQDKTKEKH